MKRKIKNILCYFIAILISGCVTYKPDSRGISHPDYNQRVSITSPHYDKVLTPIGVASITASTLSAGYAGYNSNLIRINDGANQTTSKIGNALIGATVGFGASYIVNRLLGWGKTKPANDPEQWLKKANRSYSLISYSDDLFAIPKNADEKYQIKNLEDANQFVTIFRPSRFEDDVFKSGIENLTRNDLPNLIRLFPNTKSNGIAKDKYIRTSPNYDEIVAASIKYSDLNQNYEEDFLTRISQCDHAIDFKKRYEGSVNFERAYLNAYKTDNQTKSSYINLNINYNSYQYVPIEKLRNEFSTIQKNFVKCQYMLDNSASPINLVDIFSSFKPLTFPEKEHDFLEAFMDKLDKSMPDGNEIIWNLKLLSNKEYYPEIEIEPSEIEKVISEKLQSEVASHVKISRSSYIGSKNPEWEKWKENDNYTAALVGSEDAAYILYGVIHNDSKYNLPIEVVGAGHLVSKTDVQGTGSISNFLVNAFKFLGQGAFNDLVTFDHGIQTSSFYMNPIPSMSQQEYAIRLNFHGAWVQKGVNLFDTFKGKIEPNLIDIDIRTKHTSFNPSSSIYQLQEENLKFAHNGLPDIPLQDNWRGEEVKDEKWREDWRKIREANARAREAVHRRIQAAKASGSCYESIGQENVELNSDISITGYKIKCKTNNNEEIVMYLNEDVIDRIESVFNYYNRAGWYVYKSALIGSNSSRIGGSDDDLSEVLNNLCGCY
ncbi:MAG: hypothetical protein JZU47_00465 [Prolixibacteraceae bacterium]|nr:hypothetical protein [Prolixibacteraceae bacterium]